MALQSVFHHFGIDLQGQHRTNQKLPINFINLEALSFTKCKPIYEWFLLHLQMVYCKTIPTVLIKLTLKVFLHLNPTLLRFSVPNCGDFSPNGRFLASSWRPLFCKNRQRNLGDFWHPWKMGDFGRNLRNYLAKWAISDHFWQKCYSKKY